VPSLKPRGGTTVAPAAFTGDDEPRCAGHRHRGRDGPAGRAFLEWKRSVTEADNHRGFCGLLYYRGGPPDSGQRSTTAGCCDSDWEKARSTCSEGSFPAGCALATERRPQNGRHLSPHVRRRRVQVGRAVNENNLDCRKSILERFFNSSDITILLSFVPRRANQMPRAGAIPLLRTDSRRSTGNT